MNVFLVEDSPLVCERLVEIIESGGAHRVVGRAATYEAAVEGIVSSGADVGIFDIKLARGNGIEAMIEAKRRLPALVGIVMSNYATPQHVKASAEAGAAFFLDKSSDFERITAILSTIAAAGLDKGKQ
jgi:DNA-binding NarL/FixJ family response regulator